MIDFSDLLKQYINGSGFTIYQLAQMSGVNRTTIQKAVTSGRVPQKEAFHKILSTLNLTRTERQSLMESYEFASDGEYNYRRRRYIKNFLEDIASAVSSAPSFIDLTGVLSSPFSIENGTLILGRTQLEDSLKLLLYNELQGSPTPSCSIFLPMDQELFPGFFASLNHSAGLRVRQLLYLIKNPSSYENVEFHNLKVFSHILPHLLTTASDYHVFYTYNDFAPVPESTTGFPYYILFSGYAILFSPGLDAAWLENDPQLLSYLHKRFFLITKQSQELNMQRNDAVGYIENITSIYADTCFNYSIEYQPCLLPFMDKELVEALANPLLPGRSRLDGLLEECFRQFHSMERNVVLFTEKGLEEFVQSGVIVNIPPQYARPCTPQERLTLLRRIAQACAEDRIIMRCTNPAYFTIEKQLYFSLQKNKEVSFFFYNVADNEFRSTAFRENTIYAAFYDFVEYILDSNYVLTKEETMVILTDCIGRLEQFSEELKPEKKGSAVRAGQLPPPYHTADPEQMP